MYSLASNLVQYLSDFARAIPHIFCIAKNRHLQFQVPFEDNCDPLEDMHDPDQDTHTWFQVKTFYDPVVDIL